MILLHTVLLLSALFCACSALQFSRVIKGNNGMLYPEGYVKEEFGTKIDVAYYSKRDGAILSLVDDDVNVTLNNFFLCVYRGKQKIAYYSNTEIRIPKLSHGDLLVFGENLHKDDTISALENGFLSIAKAERYESWVSRILGKSPCMAFAVILNEPHDTEKNSINSALKVSKAARILARFSAFEAHIGEKSDSFVRIVDSSSQKHLVLTISDDLEIYTNVYYLNVCIYREKKIHHCYQGTNVKNVPMFPGDILLVGTDTAKDEILRASEKRLSSEDNLASFDFWCDATTKDGTFDIIIVLIEKNENAGRMMLQKKELELESKKDNINSSGSKPIEVAQDSSSDDNSDEPIKRPPRKPKPGLDNADSKSDQLVRVDKKGSLDSSSNGASSTLRFSRVIKGINPSSIYFNSYIGEESEKQIHAGYVPRTGKAILSLVDDDVTATLGNFFICVYRNKEKIACYRNNKIKIPKLSHGDLLVFGKDSSQYAIVSALEKKFLSNYSVEDDKFWDDLVPEDKYGAFAVVLKEAHKTEEDSTGLALKFSKTARVRSQLIGPELYIDKKSDSHFRITASSGQFKTSSALSLTNKGLNIAANNLLICIYREKKIHDCYQYTDIENVPVFPGDILLAGKSIDDDKILRVSAKRLLSKDNLESFDFWRDTAIKYKSFDIIIVLIEKNENAKRKVMPQKKELELESKKDNASSGDSESIEIIQDAPRHIEIVQNSPSDDDSDTVEMDLDPSKKYISIETYNKQILSDYDATETVHKVPASEKVVQKLRFNVLPRKPSGDSVAPLYDDQSLQLEYKGSAYAVAQITLDDSNKAEVIQEGGAFVVVTDINGLKNTETLKFQKIDDKYVASKDLSFSPDIELKEGDVVLLLVPTSDSEIHPIDWSFSKIDPGDIQEYFEALCKKYEASGITALGAKVVAR